MSVCICVHESERESERERESVCVCERGSERGRARARERERASVCVCACVRVCMRVCVCVCAREREGAPAYRCLRSCGARAANAARALGIAFRRTAFRRVLLRPWHPAAQDPWMIRVGGQFIELVAFMCCSIFWSLIPQTPHSKLHFLRYNLKNLSWFERAEADTLLINGLNEIFLKKKI